MSALAPAMVCGVHWGGGHICADTHGPGSFHACACGAVSEPCPNIMVEPERRRDVLAERLTLARLAHLAYLVAGNRIVQTPKVDEAIALCHRVLREAGDIE